ncbi:hypothetical protein N7537_010017 [Penicillium hordei]|uniref:Uncharacterized protein n=1 Tax=Penicillium hordei TaxID=40994 RepID=A0AAD6GW94_9EURO|nr:uncharacterized protein N7537_010017 [Penicillium hordei]KAJ5593113.1 hypothetical protein N7537_010017 [Penicillium hordei]
MRIISIFAALLAVAFASPNLEARQQGESCEVVHGASCASKGLVQCGSSSGNVRACCVCSLNPDYYCCEREFLTAAETLLLNVFRGVEGAKDCRLMNSPSKSTLDYMAMNVSR